MAGRIRFPAPLALRAPFTIDSTEIDSLAVERLVGGTISAEEIILAGSGAIIRSENFVSGTSGWQIDGSGNAEFNNVVIRGDIESGNWDGASPANLASKDGTATVGFYLDSSAGAAQFEGSVWIGGALEVAGAASLLSTLTMGTGGVIRTSSATTRLEISNANVSRLDFYQGGGTPGAKIVGGTAGANTLHVLADTILFSDTADSGFRMSITSAGAVNLFGGGTTLFRTTSTGLVEVGSSTAVVDLHWGLGNNDFIRYDDTGGVKNWYLFSDAAAVATISTTFARFEGDLQVVAPATTTTGNTATWVNVVGGLYEIRFNTSSARYKKDIRPWDRRHPVLALTPSLFRSTAGTDDKRKLHLGLIAEDVAEHFPLAALYDNEKRPDGINWNAITAALLGEVQMLQRRVAQLEVVSA